MDFDVVVIGGGVVGLACCMKIAEKGLDVLLVERHPSFGYETSSRNSEVIHAGIYYPKDSLKARLCVEGNRSLYRWCLEMRVPHRRIGKYIVAVNDSEAEELDILLTKAIGNGVENIGKADMDKLRREEPYIKCKEALFSGDTGIIDTHSLMGSFSYNAKDLGAVFAWNHSVTGIEFNGGKYGMTVEDSQKNRYKLNCRQVVNSAGLDSDKVASLAGIDTEASGYKLHYCKGHYFRIIPSKNYLVKHLIYPVPQKDMPGLGIHITPDLAGGLKLGPDSSYMLERLQDYTVPEILRAKFYYSASQYLNGLGIDDIYPDQSGIRPKLYTNGGEFRDFIINEESSKGFPGFINLIGIESPGLTSCIEIAEIVVKMLD